MHPLTKAQCLESLGQRLMIFRADGEPEDPSPHSPEQEIISASPFCSTRVTSTVCPPSVSNPSPGDYGEHRAGTERARVHFFLNGKPIRIQFNVNNGIITSTGVLEFEEICSGPKKT